MRKSTLLLLTLLLGFLPALAQQVVTGTVVTAPDNEAAIGASIIVKEHSKVGTTVGLDGSFKITVPAGSKILRISYIGYLTQEVPIKDKMKITLEPSEKTLDKVVVTGLTKVDKRLFTGPPLSSAATKPSWTGYPTQPAPSKVAPQGSRYRMSQGPLVQLLRSACVGRPLSTGAPSPSGSSTVSSWKTYLM